MSTYDYSPITATALRLLTKYGTTCTLTRKGDGGGWSYEYDTVEMQYHWKDGDGNVVYLEPSEAVTTDDGIAVVTNFSNEELANDLIKVSDLKLVLMDTIEPQLNDTFTVGSKEYKYVSHKNIAPVGDIILYIVQVRI